jgi:Coenzyme PQQ synthesis protein D (PqqD)
MIWIPASPGARLPAVQRVDSTKHDGGARTMLNISDTIRSTRTVDGRVVLDVRRGRMFSVNPVGSKILELLEQGQDEPRIAEEISRLYAMNIEVVRPDVQDFIEALREHHIVRATDSVESKSDLHIL